MVWENSSVNSSHCTDHVALDASGVSDYVYDKMCERQKNMHVYAKRTAVFISKYLDNINRRRYDKDDKNEPIVEH